VDSVVEKISRQIWNLPASFPKARFRVYMYVLLEDLGLNIPSVWEEYCGVAIRS